MHPRKTIFDYIDAAKTKQGYTTNTELANAIGITTAAFSMWNKLKSYPSEANMVKLSELADIDPKLGIIDCEIWRAEGAPHTKVLTEMRQIIQSAAAVFLLAITLSFGGDTLAETPA